VMNRLQQKLLPQFQFNALETFLELVYINTSLLHPTKNCGTH